MTVLPCMISIPITRSTMKITDGKTLTEPMTTEAGTAGEEGDTQNPEILRLRRQLMKTPVPVLMCSRGTPMFLAGDEFGNTQFGNNNPYCQDNEISWLNWEQLKDNEEIFEFFKFMIHFRKDHTILRKDNQSQFQRFPISQSSWDRTLAGRVRTGYQDDRDYVRRTGRGWKRRYPLSGDQCLVGTGTD